MRAALCCTARPRGLTAAPGGGAAAASARRARQLPRPARAGAMAAPALRRPRSAAGALLAALALLAAAPAAAAPAVAPDECGADYRLHARAEGCRNSGDVCLLWTDLSTGGARSGCWVVREPEQALALDDVPILIDEAKTIHFTYGKAGATPTTSDPELPYTTKRAPCDDSPRGKACCGAPLKISALFTC
jgi:hypothetical protein